MIGRQIKIVALVLALSFFAASVLVAYYYVQKHYIPEREALDEIVTIQENPPAPPDPGIKRFNDALALFDGGEENKAREVLYELMAVYDDSTRFDDAKRIVGEMNMDQLLSRRPMPGKLDYLVKRGDALASIARRNRSTIPYIRRVNPIGERTIHPNDRLVLFPLEFEVTIDLTANTLQLDQNGKLFKEYSIIGGEMPPGIRIPTKLQVASVSAWIGDEEVRSTAPEVGAATKMIQCARPRSTLGVVIAPQPTTEEERNRLPYGIFLEDENVEELYMVLRKGNIVSITK